MTDSQIKRTANMIRLAERPERVEFFYDRDPDDVPIHSGQVGVKVWKQDGYYLYARLDA